MSPGARGPVVIAHGQGNTSALAQAAMSAGADYLEIDLWIHRGRFEARHERRFPHPAPVLFEKWYLRFAPRRPMDLASLAAESTSDIAQTGIFLDLKNASAGIAPMVAETAAAYPNHPFAASSQRWATLRMLSTALPDLPVYYSIDVQAQLDLVFSLSSRDHTAAGVSCRHTLLDEPTVGRLHALGLEVVAWTVNNADRAVELASWGVEGVTTDDVASIVERLRP